MSAKPVRPTCANCAKVLGRKHFVISVQFDQDPASEVAKRIPNQFVVIVDKPHHLAEMSAKRKKAYEEALERWEFDALRVKGENEKPPQALQHMPFGWPREQPRIKDFTYFVRIWNGHYGYDGNDVFHSGECAKRWGTRVAKKLRAEGKL